MVGVLEIFDISQCGRPGSVSHMFSVGKLDLESMTLPDWNFSNNQPSTIPVFHRKDSQKLPLEKPGA